MALYIEPEKEDASVGIIKAAGAIGQVASVFSGIKKDAAAAKLAEGQEARAAETHGLDIEKKRDQMAHDKSSEGYLGGMQEHAASGSEEPFKVDFDAPDFDPRGYSSAQILFATEGMKNQEFMRSKMQTHKAQAGKQFEEINVSMGKAQAAVTGENPNYEKAFGHIEEAYEMHNDGVDLIMGKDGKSYSVKLPTGETMNSTFSSSQAMYEDFQSKFAAFRGPKGSENYSELYMKNQGERMQRNAGKIADSKYFSNSKGDQVQVAYLEGTDGKGANRYLAWDRDDNFLGEISEKSFSEGNFKDVTQRKGEAAISESKAKARKADRVTAAELKNMGPDEKAAIGIARIYGVPKEDAMDFVLSGKADKPKIAIIAKLMDDYPARTDPDTGQVELHSKVKAAIKGMGLESAFAPTSDTPGAGLRKKSRVRKLKEEETRKTNIKAGKGVSGLTKGNTTEAEKTSIRAIIAKIKKANPKWTDAKVAQVARNEFTK